MLKCATPWISAMVIPHVIPPAGWVMPLFRGLRGRRGIDEAAGLPPPQLGVVAAGAEQFGMRALLDDAAAVDHDEPVHPRDRRKPMRDGDHGLAGHQRVEARLDRGLDLAVERGGGL